MDSEPSTSASMAHEIEDDPEDVVLEELRRVPHEDLHDMHDAEEEEEEDLMPQGSVGSHHSHESTSQSNRKNGEPEVKKLLDQERFLPIANVVRLMKRIMDPNAKLAKDAKECVQECTSEFISFIAAEAADMCGQQKRKTILADDLLTAMESLGFDNYAEPMRIFLQKYRQVHKITGPYHHEHPNYRRPPQFENDPPVAPLFFTSEQGDRRSTETKYVINKTEVIKNAPFDGEWNELTGEHTGNLVDRVQREAMDDDDVLYDGSTMEDHRLVEGEEIEGEEEEADDNPLGAIALEQQQQMQIYYDPKSNQHYAAKETPTGMELYPLVIDSTPLQLENVDAEPNHFLATADEEDQEDHDEDPNQPSTSSAIYRDNQQPHSSSSHQYYPSQQDPQQYHSRHPPRHPPRHQNHHQPKRRKVEEAEHYEEEDYDHQNPEGKVEDRLQSHQGPIPTLNSLVKPPRTPRPVPPHRMMGVAPASSAAGKRTPQKRKK